MLTKLLGLNKESETTDMIDLMKSSLVDLTSVNLMIADLSGKILYMNSAVEKMLRGREATIQQDLPDFKVDSIVGSNFDRYHKNPSHQQRLLSNPDNLPYTSEISVAGLSFRLTAFAIRDKQGRHIGNAVQWEDITELKKSQLKIGQLASTVENATVNIMMADNDANIIYMNPAVRNMLKQRESQIRQTFPNFDVDKLIGTNIDRFHKNPTVQRSILADESRLPYESKINLAGIEFKLTAFALKDEQGNRIGSCVQWEDLMSNEDFANSKGQLDAIRQNYAVIEFDTNGEVLDANDIFLQTMEYSREEVIGKHHRMFVDPSYASSNEYREFWEALKSGKFQFGEFPRFTKSGNRIWLQGSYCPIKDMFGNTFKVVKYAIDVTPRRHAVDVVANSLKSLADGNLTDTVDVEIDPDFEALKTSLNRSMAQLRDMVMSIIQASEQVSSSAKEISLGNADLSQRTEEQASSLEETASSMEQFTSTVKQTAANAKKATELADNAQKLAEEGGKVVLSAVAAMQEIEKSSKKIADIISVIDEIAFQTNLLALNASVEAARAGEQGRGFAVVASEVRNLAQRSADAAKEIKALIQDSVSKVTDGTKLVDKSGETLKAIVKSVIDVNQIINDINNASQEQASGIEQVNEAITQMDEMTQQNAALVEQAAASAESLEEQSVKLLEMMKFFYIGDDVPVDAVKPPKGKSASVTKVDKQQSRRSSSFEIDDDDEWQEF